MSTFKVKRYHDFSYGHRVVGHEGKCRHLHGHNGRIHFVCESEYQENIKKGLDSIGRVIDFGEVKSRLCMWLEENWDHKFLAWDKDSLIIRLSDAALEWHDENCTTSKDYFDEESKLFDQSIVFVPFNPTAENMAEYLVEVIGPQQLKDTGIKLVEVTIDETQKCSVTYAG